MGLTFNNPNDLNKMLDKFATVPDPKKTPKRPSLDKVSKKEEEAEDKSEKKKTDK